MWASLKRVTATTDPQTDTSLPCYTVSIPSTSLTLTSTQRLQLKLTVYCPVSSIQKARSYLISEEVHQEKKSPFKMKRRLGSTEHLLWSNTRHPSRAEYCPQTNAQTSRNKHLKEVSSSHQHCRDAAKSCSNSGHSFHCFSYNFWTVGE